MTFRTITYVISCLILLQTLPLQTASAQMDWLKSGKELLGTTTKDPQNQTIKASDLTSSEIGGGLKDALLVGTETVVEQLGQSNGFNSDPAILSFSLNLTIRGFSGATGSGQKSLYGTGSKPTRL